MQARILTKDHGQQVFHGGGPAAKVLPTDGTDELVELAGTLQAEKVTGAALHYPGARPQLF